MRTIDHATCSSCGHHWFLFFNLWERIFFPINYSKHHAMFLIDVALHQSNCVNNRVEAYLADQS